jgi:mono/diheme cytochrome c family protein
MTSSAPRYLRVLVGFVAACTLLGCHLERARTSEGIDDATVPEDLRDDYALFAQRCSKCHTLARPLQSGITSDDYWEQYVARMRRQPGSGIAPDEVKPILRFLHYYSVDVRARQAARSSARSAETAPAGDAGSEPDAS